jgi:hypothetical protein
VEGRRHGKEEVRTNWRKKGREKWKKGRRTRRNKEKNVTSEHRHGEKRWGGYRSGTKERWTERIQKRNLWCPQKRCTITEK